MEKKYKFEIRSKPAQDDNDMILLRCEEFYLEDGHVVVRVGDEMAYEFAQILKTETSREIRELLLGIVDVLEKMKIIDNNNYNNYRHYVSEKKK